MDGDWSLRTWGHSCVSISVATLHDRRVQLLLDPGDLTQPLDGVGPVDAVLVTHAHPDHLDVAQLLRVDPTRQVPIYGPEAVVRQTADAGFSGAVTVVIGSTSVHGVAVDVLAAPHEPIHPEIPLPDNLAYRIGPFFAPGDSFHVPGFDVDILLLPIGAPWLKLSETVDYLRAVTPRTAVLVHGAGLAAPHRALARTLITKLAPAGTTVLDPATGEALTA